MKNNIHYDYRILKENINETLYVLVEVYYDNVGNIESYSLAPAPCSSSLNGLKEYLYLYKQALAKPIIDLDKIKMRCR